MPKTQKGFTLVELLIVIGIISILTGITIQVINVSGQRNRAEDGIRLANISKLVEGVEAYHGAEGFYPASLASASDYIGNIPNGSPTATDTYNYSVTANRLEFGLSIATEVITNGYKYRSEWGNIQECADIDASNTNCN